MLGFQILEEWNLKANCYRDTNKSGCSNCPEKQELDHIVDYNTRQDHKETLNDLFREELSHLTDFGQGVGPKDL